MNEADSSDTGEWQPAEQGGLHVATPAPFGTSLNDTWRSSFPEAPTVQILVLTYNRAASLRRLLASLQAADYEGLPQHNLRVCVDRSVTGDVDAETLEVLHNVTWSCGILEVLLQPVHRGLAGQWHTCWGKQAKTLMRIRSEVSQQGAGRASAIGVFLEDDMQVSPLWALWLVRAALAYKDHPHIKHFTLQRPQIRATDGRPLGAQIPLGSGVFGYRLFGSWGFASFRKPWEEFLLWDASQSAGSSQARVPGLIMNDWWLAGMQAGKTDSMWGVHFHTFNKVHDYFTLFCNLGGSLAWGANWMEAGEHYARAASGPDSSLVRIWRREYELFPESPVLLDWDGRPVHFSESTRADALWHLRSAMAAASPTHLADTTVGLTLVNSAFLPFVRSWLANTQHMANVHARTVLVCLDSDCLEGLRAEDQASAVAFIVGLDWHQFIPQQVNNMTSLDGFSLPAFLPFETSNYSLLMLARLNLATQLASTCTPFLMFETDSYWAKDPFKWIAEAPWGNLSDRQRNRPHDPVDFVGYIDSSTGAYGGGLFHVPCGCNSGRFMQGWLSAALALATSDGEASLMRAPDQLSLYAHVKAVWSELNVRHFPPRAFPSGLWYQSQPRGQSAEDEYRDSGIVIVQFNWLRGIETKITRAKAHGHWFEER